MAEAGEAVTDVLSAAAVSVAIPPLVWLAHIDAAEGGSVCGNNCELILSICA